MKQMKKVLAWLLAIVLLVGVAPTKMRAVSAATKTVYQQVQSLSSNGEYLIVYHNGTSHFALAWDGTAFTAVEGTVVNDEFQPAAQADEGQMLWKYNSKSGFTLVRNSGIAVATDGSQLLSNGQYKFKMQQSWSGNEFRANLGEWYETNYRYLSYENGSWKVSATKNANISFYKKTQVEGADDILYPDDATGEEKPQYPDQGAVRVQKTATSDDFKGTGVAKVELGTTGVPMKKGVDVVVVFDVSTSMSNVQGKLESAKQAAKNFVNQVFADNADGTKSNNRLGFVTFAGYNSDNNAGNEIKYQLKNATAKAEILNTIDGLRTYAGTDYDYAFSGAQAVLNSAAPGRDKFVVFMTDGSPSEYNGKQWDDRGFASQAISTNLKNADTVKQNGAKVYSIGFDLSDSTKEDSNGFTGKQAKEILQKIASDPSCFIDANDSNKLNEAFSNIASAIKKAGTEAVVTDTIGAQFDLQKTTTLPNNKPALTFDPTIQVTAYDLYTRADVGTVVDGKEITLNDVGTRKGTSTVLETVRFTNAGTQATSNLLIGNIMNPSGNIKAKHFTYDAAKKTFTWTIGDITEQEMTLSYYAYLKGSMEGHRGDGLYDTNEHAQLDYKNYKGNATVQEFPKPKMPWGSAIVNYEFYLVNASGEPVNSRGDVIPFANRVKLSETKQVKFNWNNATNINAKVEASKFVPKGYTLHISDAAYTANAVSSGTGSHEILGTVPQGVKQSTIMYQADPQYVNSYVAFGVLNETKLIPDAIVLDYGKPVTIDVMKNDMVMNAVLDSVAPAGTNVGVNLGDGSTETLVTGFQKEVPLTNGKVNVDAGKVKYTPTKYMDSIDRFLYAAKVTTGSTQQGGADINYYRYQEVDVIPATTVYYEDTFGNTTDTDTGNGIVFSGDWTVEGTTDTSEQDSHGTENHPYGNDDSYKNNGELSGGSAHKIVAAKGKNPTATFTFKGTGFDLIGRTDATSGKIMVKVFEGDKRVKSNIIDLQYHAGTLHQIPVYRAELGKYGTYKVEITMGQLVNEAEAPKTFYLDAIRVYNPIDPNGTDATDANDQYSKDKEANADVREMRKMLLEQYAGGTLNGAVYVDSQTNSNGETITDVSKYEMVGPNNEIYLKKGNSIGFKIKANADPESVQLGAKLVQGTAATLTVGSTKENEKSITLNTATDMYYHIKNTLQFVVGQNGERTADVVITNTSTEDVILSLTNLKLTYAQPTAAAELYTDEQVAEKTVALTKARMHIPEVKPEVQPEVKPEVQPETPSIEHVIKDVVEKVHSVVEQIFGGIFGKWF